jgi:hypothetical protein
MKGLKVNTTIWQRRKALGACFVMLVGVLLPAVASADQWTFVWVGATAQGWTIVQGTATAKFGDGEIHFDLVSNNAAKYTVDVQVQKDGAAEAGLAGLGGSYAGITVLTGKFGKRPVSRECKVEVLNVQNDFNSLSIGKFGTPDCSR